MKKIIALLCVVFVTLFGVTACGKSTNQTTSQDSTVNTKKEKTGNKNNDGIPRFIVAWGKDLHTGMMQLAFLAPNEFQKNDTYLKPIDGSRLELIKNGKTIAELEVIQSQGGSDTVTMMSQNNCQIAYCSSTAVMSGYDSGADLKILGPVQSGGVSITASKNAPYNSFEELVAYAKKEDKPIQAGYHSPVSSPRIVLEYALKEEGLKVSENTADYKADVLMTDLKGLTNLIPSLSSGQVELWAGPVPHPQNAESQNIGKIIATLNDLPKGKWVDFPCCTMNARNDVIDKHPEVIQGLADCTTDIMNFAQKEPEKTRKLLGQFLGLDQKVMEKNDTTYSTQITDKFINGMKTYVEVMEDMGKYTGRLKGKTPEEAYKLVVETKYFKK